MHAWIVPTHARKEENVLNYVDDLSGPLLLSNVSLMDGKSLSCQPKVGWAHEAPELKLNVAISLAGFPGEDVDEPQAWLAETAQPLTSDALDPSSR